MSGVKDATVFLSTTYNGSKYDLGYILAPTQDPDLGAQDGYYLYLYKDGVIVTGTNLIKQQVLGGANGTALTQSQLFIKQTNQWLTAHCNDPLSPVPPPVSNDLLTAWQQSCQALFPKFSFSVVANAGVNILQLNLNP